ncbi:MAG: hypothetical protein ABIP75_11900 [Pyrinomonadaceae bacterium]
MKNIWRFGLTTIFVVFLYANVFGQDGGPQATPFDSFGRVGLEEASARLDNFAIAVDSLPDSIGYVVGYGPEGTGSGSGRHMLGVIVDYLSKTRGLDPSRIVTRYAGRYRTPTELFAESWILAPGDPLPTPKRYDPKISDLRGMMVEYRGYENYDDCGCGPNLGNLRLATFSDHLREQPGAVGYVVAYRAPDSAPGIWRRLAKRDAAEIVGEGIAADRVKIIFGGTNKATKEDDDFGQARLQLWILPAGEPPPVKEAKNEKPPKEATQIGSYSAYQLSEPADERSIFEGFADVLRADARLNVCLIVRPKLGSDDPDSSPLGEPEIELGKLADKWKSQLLSKFGIKDDRFTILLAPSTETVLNNTIEVWVLPAGAALPDPYPPDPEDGEEIDEP